MLCDIGRTANTKSYAPFSRSWTPQHSCIWGALAPTLCDTRVAITPEIGQNATEPLLADIAVSRLTLPMETDYPRNHNEDGSFDREPE